MKLLLLVYCCSKIQHRYFRGHAAKGTALHLLKEPMNTQASPLLPAVAPREVPAALIDALKSRFLEQCSTALVVREQHGRDESSFEAPPPAAVVFAQSTQDVADAVKLAGGFNVPVIPFGVGTSLEGHLLAVYATS